jgi:taurine dioxygenase
MLETALKVQKAGGCGALVRDIDLADLTDAEAADLRQALFDHGVLFFRDQSLTPEQHIALAERFAPIDVNRYFPADPAYPQIAKVEKTEDQVVNIGGGWHTDHSYDAEPAMGSILVARKLPPSGGDTLFADMYAAYDSLAPDLQQKLRGMKAVHSSAHIFGEAGAYAQTDQSVMSGSRDLPETLHPVIIRHPGSGKPVLYVNPAFTIRFEGQTREESLPLLMDLYAHAIAQDHVHTFVWAEGSVAIWDNRASWHFAKNDYHGHYRLMHRITLQGEALEAA